jgi:hypothetical protein
MDKTSWLPHLFGAPKRESPIGQFPISTLAVGRILRWPPCRLKRVARTAVLAVRVFSVAVGSTVGYSTAVSKLRRPFLSKRYFFITVRAAYAGMRPEEQR